MTEIRACGHQAAHSPHRRGPLTEITDCPGIAPIWPCGIAVVHFNHWVSAGGYHCPGTLVPPRDMIGPAYSDDGVERE